MAYVWADRVLETSTTTGVGPLALAGAVTKNRTFASVCSVADTLPYAIINLDANEWEVGLGTYSAANELTRTTVQASSNGGAAVNFSAGTKRVGLSTTAGSLVPSTGGTMTGPLQLPSGAAGAAALAFGGAGVGFHVESSTNLFYYTGGSAQFFIQGNGAAATIVVDRYQATSSSPAVAFRKARGSLAVPAVSVMNDSLGSFSFQGYGDTAFKVGASLAATTIAATPSDTDMESRLLFSCSAAGSVSPTEIIRADHATGLSMFGANSVIDSNRLFRLRQYTVATLPTVGTAGRLAAVTDATAPTYNGALTGGGAVNVPVYDNGAAWVSH